MAFGIKWLKPEVDKPIYYVHVAIIATVVLGILQLLFQGNMFNIKNILLSIPLITLGDIIAHSLLKLD